MGKIILFSAARAKQATKTPNRHPEGVNRAVRGEQGHQAPHWPAATGINKPRSGQIFYLGNKK